MPVVWCPRLVQHPKTVCSLPVRYLGSVAQRMDHRSPNDIAPVMNSTVAAQPHFFPPPLMTCRCKSLHTFGTNLPSHGKKKKANNTAGFHHSSEVYIKITHKWTSFKVRGKKMGRASDADVSINFHLLSTVDEGIHFPHQYTDISFWCSQMFWNNTIHEFSQHSSLSNKHKRS